MTLVDTPHGGDTPVPTGGHYVCTECRFPVTLYRGQRFPTSCPRCELEGRQADQAIWWFRLFDFRQWPERPAN